jgi:hypothetical protein
MQILLQLSLSEDITQRTNIIKSSLLGNKRAKKPENTPLEPESSGNLTEKMAKYRASLGVRA